MRRRGEITFLWLMSLGLMLVWLISEQLPIWTAPQTYWLTPTSGAYAPAACEAASLLRAFNGTRGQPGQPMFEQAARATALGRAESIYGPGLRYSVGSADLFTVALMGEKYISWLVTVRVESESAPERAAIVFVDAEGGRTIDAFSVTQANDPSTCQFDARRALIDMLRSAPVLIIAGFTAVSNIVILVGGVMRKQRQRRSAAHGTAA